MKPANTNNVTEKNRHFYLFSFFFEFLGNQNNKNSNWIFIPNCNAGFGVGCAFKYAPNAEKYYLFSINDRYFNIDKNSFTQ